MAGEVLHDLDPGHPRSRPAARWISRSRSAIRATSMALKSPIQAT